MRIAFSVGLAVESFLDDEDPDVEFAFEDARSSPVEAADEARDEIAGALGLEAPPRGVRIISVEFCEFDSANPTHAVAYYDVEAEVPEGSLPKLVEAGLIQDPAEE
jgi:hypothetical protein